MRSVTPFQRRRQGHPLRCRTTASSAGFSLLETLFALLVLGISVAVLAGSLITAMRADDNNQARNTGLYLANQLSEQIVGQYEAMGTPCASGSCGSFTDANGTTVDLNDNLASAPAGQPVPAPDFSTTAQSGYSETVWVGNNCSGAAQSGCQEYDVRWNIYTPSASYALGASSSSSVQLAHLICVAARPYGVVSVAPAEVYAAAP
ncbi:MAG: type IV pilus modification PilV family protein [Terriglobales bacterium]